MTPEQLRADLEEKFVKALVEAGCPPAKAQLVAEGLARSASEIIEAELASLPL